MADDTEILQCRMAAEDAGLRVTVGWAPWKRSLAKAFFHSLETELRHAKSLDAAVAMVREHPRGKLLLWGAAEAPTDPTVPVVRVEDGFLRSSGLGAKFHRPLSWVTDERGIYFDPRTPSRLEEILEAGDFTNPEMSDADELLRFLREHRLTKYNLGADDLGWHRRQADGRKVILVPGQVEADASIRCGSPELNSNEDLLRRVRAAEPDAFLIFKAHPDLVAAARHGQVLPPSADALADLAVVHGNALDWLDVCDEVQTMTSTLGFEAILRGVPVVTHGLPFYAGWGLTCDRLPCPRRTRQLTLEELVCGAMICYPRYLDPRSGKYTTAIRIARLLASGELAQTQPNLYLRLGSVLKNAWVKLARHRRLT